MARRLRVAGVFNLVLVPVAWATIILSLSSCNYACSEPDGNYAGGFVVLLMLSLVTVALAVVATVSPFPAGRPQSTWQRRAASAMTLMLIVTAGLLLVAAVSALMESAR